MEVQERLARLVLHNVSAANHAARRLRQGSELELRLEPTATGSLQLMASHDGRLLGRVEPIPREYIEWIRTCKDNRCTVDSIPVAEQDHLLKLILVRIQRGEPIGPMPTADVETLPPSKPKPGPKAKTSPAPEPEPEPEPDPEPQPEPEPEAELEELPALIAPERMPVAVDVERYYAESYFEPRQPTGLRRHGLKFLLVLGFMAITAAAASGVHYLNTPCGRLWATVGGTSHCRFTPDQNLRFETGRANASQLCSPELAAALPEVKILRITLTSSTTPVLVTCRLSK